MSVEIRVSLLEEAILTMKSLVVNHNERLEDYYNLLQAERIEREASRSDFEFKLNALIDAQIRNESEIG